MHVIGIDTGHLSDAAQANAWLQETDPQSALSCIGYLSMEPGSGVFGVSQARHL